MLPFSNHTFSYMQLRINTVFFSALARGRKTGNAHTVTLFCFVFSCRGVVKMDINLQKVDIDQCSSEGWFSGTHRCHLNNSEVSVYGNPGVLLTNNDAFCHVAFLMVRGIYRQDIREKIR